jgi:hypothetical protein
MSDGERGDLHEQILHIEAHIEGLTDIIERCRKIILISKVAIRWLRLSEQNFRVDKWRLCRG